MTTNQIIELAYEALKGNKVSNQIINDIFEENGLKRLDLEVEKVLEIENLQLEKVQLEKVYNTLMSNLYEEAFFTKLKEKNETKRIN